MLKTEGGNSILLDDTPGVGASLSKLGGQKIKILPTGIEIDNGNGGTIKLHRPQVSVNSGALKSPNERKSTNAAISSIKSATVLCMHGGQAQATVPNPRVKISGQADHAAAEPVDDRWLSFVAGNTPMPCVTAQWTTAATRVKSGGMPLLMQDSQAVCALTAPA